MGLKIIIAWVVTSQADFFLRSGFFFAEANHWGNPPYRQKAWKMAIHSKGTLRMEIILNEKWNYYQLPW